MAVEAQRYKRPKVPEDERYCQYCRPGGTDNNLEGYVDNEEHFLTACSSFALERNCLLARLSSLSMGYHTLNRKQLTATLLCPTSVVTAKLVNKYIQLLFNVRRLLDEGVPAFNLGFESGSMCHNVFFNDIDESPT